MSGRRGTLVPWYDWGPQPMEMISMIVVPETPWPAASGRGKATLRWVSLFLSTVVILAVGAGPGYAQESARTVTQNRWTATGSMATPRVAHTATLLPNGKVLVVGGRSTENAILASAELYDPASHTWSATGSLHVARRVHTATLLPSGKVLVAGGFGVYTYPVSSSELYDPATGLWSVTGPMVHARGVFTATLLPNGYVLAAGGSGPRATNTAEIYHPATGLWYRTNALPAGSGNEQATATLLPTGKVLIAGGANPLTQSASIYQPSDYRWWKTGGMVAPRCDHTATLLGTGKVLVVGGTDGTPGSFPTPELYNIATHRWSPASNQPYGGAEHTATLLRDGTVLIAGGTTIGSANGVTAATDRYNPTTSAWTDAGNMPTPRLGHTATLLSDGSVLMAGGAGPNGVVASAELFTSS